MNVISGRQALSPCYAICMVIYTIGHLLMIHYCNRLFDKCVIKRVTSVIIMNVVMTMCSFLNACCARERMWLLSLLLFYFHVFLFRMFVLLPCISIQIDFFYYCYLFTYICIQVLFYFLCIFFYIFRLLYPLFPCIFVFFTDGEGNQY